MFNATFKLWNAVVACFLPSSIVIVGAVAALRYRPQHLRNQYNHDENDKDLP
jgi:hypothetical protein